MKEIWKDIPGYEGIYQASTKGNIKSLSRKIWTERNKCFSIKKERILKPILSTTGYFIVGLCYDGRTKQISIHQLVAIVFLNHKLNGTHEIVVDHINNIKTDNRIENLQLVTHRKNCSKDIKNKSSQYVGVSWHKPMNKWKATICINKIKIHLGYFEKEIEAYNVYLNKLLSVV